MANNLATEKQATIVSALAEGNSIRSIERMTGVKIAIAAKAKDLRPGG